MYILQANKVEKKFANHLALNKVSISVPEGSVYGLLGPNGAGKTTLIRIINQITAPDSGTVLFNGERLSQKHIYQIGYLPEERGLYKKMKVGEQAVYLAQLKGLSAKEAKKRLKYWFDKFEILEWWDRKVEELSKGMQQKVQFIITILHEPKLLIFDEPFSGFDPINTQLLKDEILKLRERGATIIFSTHNMASVEEICDEIALINRSNNILEGKVDTIRNSYKKDLYEITLECEQSPIEFLSPMFEVLECSEKENNCYGIKLKNTPSLASNDLVKCLIERAQLREFRSILPSMNDVFIEAVERANTQDNKRIITE